MLYGDILDHLMKQSSTKAFPNGLIPSPFARQVKIFTHWISDCGDLLMKGACLQVCLFYISMLMLTMNMAIFKKIWLTRGILGLITVAEHKAVIG